MTQYTYCLTGYVIKQIDLFNINTYLTTLSNGKRLLYIVSSCDNVVTTCNRRMDAYQHDFITKQFVSKLQYMIRMAAYYSDIKRCFKLFVS
jgi:hypothetical protein